MILLSNYSVQRYLRLVTLMVFVTWEQVDQARQRYGNSGLPAVVDAAKTFLCGLNDNRQSFTNFDPTGFGNFVSGTWDRICDRKEDPKFDVGPAGRCEWGFLYSVKLNNPSGSQPFPNINGSFGVRSAATPKIVLSTSGYTATIRGGDNSVGTSFYSWGSGINWDKSYGGAKLVSQEIILCTSQPPEIAPALPPISPSPPPTADDLKVTTPIQISPTIIAPLIFTLIRPTINATLNANAKFDIRPTINLPDLNLNLKFDAAGVEFNYYGGGDGSPIPIPQPDPRDPIPLPPSDPGAPVDLSPLIGLLEDIQDCACPPTQTGLVSLGSGRSGIFGLPSNTIGVILTLTSTPDNKKSEQGFLAPDVFYAGWFSFSRNGNGGVRHPINYLGNWARREPQEDGFSFTCRSGFTASVVAILG